MPTNAATIETSLRVLKKKKKKIKRALSRDHAISFLDDYPQRLVVDLSQRYLHTNNAQLFPTAESWNLPRCPSTEQRRRKM